MAAILVTQLLANASLFAEDPPNTQKANIRTSIAKLRVEARDRGWFVHTPMAAPVGASHRNGVGQKVTAGFAMGVLGAFAGAYVGSRFGRDCACDDPGLTGGLVGMSVGTIGGAIVGVWLASQ